MKNLNEIFKSIRPTPSEDPRPEAPERGVEGVKSDENIENQINKVLEIINPGDLPLADYEKLAFDDLFTGVKKMQASQGQLLEAPSKSLEQMKDLLLARLHYLLDDAAKEKERTNKKSKISPEIVKRAKIALLSVHDFTDLNRYSERDIEKFGIAEFRNYLVQYEKGNLTEEDIDNLIKAGFKKNLSDSELYRYIDKSHGACDTIPKSLMIGLTQSEVNNRSFPLGYALEAAQPGKYDNETLEHLLANGYSDLCLKHADKFAPGAIQKILESGNVDDRKAISTLLALELSQPEFEGYIDTLVKHNKVYGIIDANGAFNNRNLETHRLPYQDILEKKREIENDTRKEISDSDKLATIKDIVKNGQVSFAACGHASHRYLIKYIEANYEEFRDTVSSYDQEHLVLEYLKDDDREAYAQKLLKAGNGYQLVSFLKSFPEHCLAQDNLDQLKSRGFAPDLKGDLSRFKNLSEAEALELIGNNDADIFIDNFNSFSVSPDFLLKPPVQNACFRVFLTRLASLYPEKARIVCDRIPFPADQVREAVIADVRDKLIKQGRMDWACKDAKAFPELRDSLAALEFQKRALLELQTAGGYASSIADVLESFPLPQEILAEPEIRDRIAGVIKREYSHEYNSENIKNLERDFENIDRISKYIKLPDYIFEFVATSQEVKGMQSQPFYVMYEVMTKVAASLAPAALYQNILKLLEELRLKNDPSFNKDLALGYIAKFENGGTAEEKERFFEDLKRDIAILAKNQIPDFSADLGYYKYILNEVYPKRNYDTYQNIDKYEDRSSDLDKYVFDRAGYKLELSGVLGYRIKDGAVTDQGLIDEYSARIKAIKDISIPEKLAAFLDKNIAGSKAETLEGKILEYFKQNGYSIDTMNVLLAHQLLGRYDNFVADSTDRVSLEDNQVSKNYILLDELANQYGDNMKETIKQIQSKVAKSPDLELFASHDSEKDRKRYIEAGAAIISDLARLPREKITDIVLQKKIAKTIRNTFQGVSDVQGKSEYFASLFTEMSLTNFQTVWDQKFDELFAVRADSLIDMAKVEKLQMNAYQKLQSEISKYEEIKEVDSQKGETKLAKERSIKAYFSKNKENAHARMVGDICLANDPEMLKDEKYFEFVFFDEERAKCMGTTMLLEMKEPDGRKYLLYCPNPSVGLVSEVSAKKLYQLITKQVAHFAETNGFDGVVVDKKHGRSTNRAGLFQQSLEQSCLKDKAGQEKVLNLKENHALGLNYSYQEDLRLVWEKVK